MIALKTGFHILLEQHIEPTRMVNVPVGENESIDAKQINTKGMGVAQKGIGIPHIEKNSTLLGFDKIRNPRFAKVVAVYKGIVVNEY